MAIKNSILPGNLPELERLIESTEQRITELDIPIETLWNPWECPAVVLPWLAWAVSVDVWDTNWTEQTKRQVIAASPYLHSIKGTPLAVKTALETLNLDSDYREWHELEPKGAPGTFEIDVYVSDSGITQNLINNADLSIKRNKRATAHYQLKISLLSKSEMRIGCASISSFSPTIYPHYQSDISSGTAISIATASKFINKTTIYPGVF